MSPKPDQGPKKGTPKTDRRLKKRSQNGGRKLATPVVYSSSRGPVYEPVFRTRFRDRFWTPFSVLGASLFLDPGAFCTRPCHYIIGQHSLSCQGRTHAGEGLCCKHGKQAKGSAVMATLSVVLYSDSCNNCSGPHKMRCASRPLQACFYTRALEFAQVRASFCHWLPPCGIRLHGSVCTTMMF